MSKKLKFDFMLLFTVFMVVVYIGVGCYLLFSPSFNYVPRNIKVVFSAFFILYGIFRFVRVYPKLFKRNRYEDD